MAAKLDTAADQMHMLSFDPRTGVGLVTRGAEEVEERDW
jgi:hypothetical protein